MDILKNKSFSVPVSCQQESEIFNSNKIQESILSVHEDSSYIFFKHEVILFLGSLVSTSLTLLVIDIVWVMNFVFIACLDRRSKLLGVRRGSVPSYGVPYHGDLLGSFCTVGFCGILSG